MKLFRQSIIIIGIYLLCEFISKAFNLPIPGNILGMLLLLFLLITRIIKVEDIDTITNFFLDHLAFFFIPAGVGLLSSILLIKDIWFKVTVVCFFTTLLVIIVTGRVVQFISKRLEKESEENIDEHNN